jgi:hypothetical protein
MRKEQIEKLVKAIDSCPQLQKAVDEFLEPGIDLRQLTGGTRIIFTDEQAQAAGFENRFFFQIRGAGSFENTAFYINESQVDAKLVTDEEGELCLVLTPKT